MTTATWPMNPEPPHPPTHPLLPSHQLIPKTMFKWYVYGGRTAGCQRAWSSLLCVCVNLCVCTRICTDGKSGVGFKVCVAVNMLSRALVTLIAGFIQVCTVYVIPSECPSHCACVCHADLPHPGEDGGVLPDCLWSERLLPFSRRHAADWRH